MSEAPNSDTSRAEVRLWPAEVALFERPGGGRLTGSQWVHTYRLMPSSSARPGPYDRRLTPFWDEVLDAWLDPRVKALTLMTSTQVGKTECLIGALMVTIDLAPRDTLFVLPTEEFAKSFVQRRLKESIQCVPRVMRHHSNRASDWKSFELSFRGMTLFVRWAGSPAELSSRPLGALLLDEEEKFPTFSGKEASPRELAQERLRWWPDATLLESSTPVLDDGPINVSYNDSDRREYHVPCPECGHYQPLRFSKETVRAPAGATADEIERGRLASYVCRACATLIPDEPAVKAEMMLAGVWCPKGNRVNDDGEVEGPVPMDGSHRGYHLNALYSPVLSWSDVLGKFKRCGRDPGKLQNFWNSWLGLPWQQTAAELVPEVLQARGSMGVERGWVPADALGLVMGVDVQMDRVFWLAQAWCPGDRVYVVDYGEVFGDEHLIWRQLDKVVMREWPIVGELERKMRVLAVNIDSRHRRSEVDAYCSTRLDLCNPIQGVEAAKAPFTATKVERLPTGQPVAGLTRWTIDTNRYKDRMLGMMTVARAGDPGSWVPPLDCPEDLPAQLCNERKVIVREARTGKQKLVWRERYHGVANHWWDCNNYATCAADMVGISREAEVLASEEPEPGAVAVAAPPRAKTGRIRSNRIRQRGER